MYYPELDCVGIFQNEIQTKRSVPFGLSPRAVEKIRSGRFDLRRDLPMDADLELRPAERGTEYDFEMESEERRMEDGFEQGFEESGQSRFEDGDVPSPLFG